MNLSMFLMMVTLCWAMVWALPLPDEEVARTSNANNKTELFDDSLLTHGKPINPVTEKPKELLENKIAAKNTEAVINKKALEPTKKVKEVKPEFKTELNLHAPDVETAPAMHEAMVISSPATKPPPTPTPSTSTSSSTPAAEDDEDDESKTVQSVPVVDAPAANAEIQKHLVDESKADVHQAPLNPMISKEKHLTLEHATADSKISDAVEVKSDSTTAQATQTETTTASILAENEKLISAESKVSPPEVPSKNVDVATSTPAVDAVKEPQPDHKSQNNMLTTEATKVDSTTIAPATENMAVETTEPTAPIAPIVAAVSEAKSSEDKSDSEHTESSESTESDESSESQKN